MPLSRLNDEFEIELEGISFGMMDRQGHRWRCLIIDKVLSDAIGGAPRKKIKPHGFALTAMLSNVSPPTNSIWAHLKMMGSSALPIGDDAVKLALAGGIARSWSVTLPRSPNSSIKSYGPAVVDTAQPQKRAVGADKGDKGMSWDGRR